MSSSSKQGGRRPQRKRVPSSRRASTPTKVDAHRRGLPLGGRLDRYVFFHFVQSYLTAMLLMTGLFMVIDMASNLDDYLETWKDGSTVPVTVLLKFYILTQPYLFLQVAPVVTLIAGMFTVAKMLKAREVTAVLSAGVSARRMLVPLFFCGVVLAVGMFLLREGLGLGVAKERDTLRYILEEQEFEESYQQLAVLEESGGNVFVNNFVPKPAGGGPPSITGLTTILRTDGRTAVTKYIRCDAEGADWDEAAGKWQLRNGIRTIIDLEKGTESQPLSTLEGYEFTPELALTYKRAYEAPLELTFSEVQELMRRDPDDTSYQTLWHYHLTFPLANIILLLVGIPLMFNYERGKGSERIAIGGLLCVFYYAADFVFRTLGIKGQLSPLLSAWVPVLIFGAIGVMLYDSLKS